LCLTPYCNFTYPHVLFTALDEHDITVLPLVPTVLALLLQSEPGRYGLASLRTITSEIPGVANDAIKAVGSTFGFVIFGIAQVTEGWVRLIGLVSSRKRELELNKQAAALRIFSEKLVAANFDMSQLGKTAVDTGKKISTAFSPEGLSRLPNSLRSLADELKNVGKSQTQILEATKNERLRIINEEVAKDVELAQLGSELKAKVIEDFGIKTGELERKRLENLARLAQEFGGPEAFRIELAQRLELLKQAKDAELLTRQQHVFAIQAVENDVAQKVANNAISIAQRTSKLQVDGKVKQLKLEKQILGESLKGVEGNAKAEELISKRRSNIEREIRTAQLGELGDFFGNASALSKTGNKNLFKIGQGAAIAQATISGFLAVQNALATQPFFPVGLGLSVKALAETQANINGIRSASLQTGLTEVPKGFNNDSFPALLTSGERVVNAPQNRDLTKFLESRDQDSGSSEDVKEGLQAIVSVLEQVSDKLDNLENEITVSVGTSEIFKELRSGIREGRSLAV